MAKKNYRNYVRLGNWNEDIFLEEEMMKDFLEKRDQGQLLIQRNRRLIANLLKPTEISFTEDGFVHYGDKVLVMNPDWEDPHGGQVVFGRLVLSVTPEEMKAHTSNDIEVPCEVTAMHGASPVGRNTFIILSLDGNALGETVRYGQNFGLGTTAGFADKMFYLGSDHKTTTRAAKLSSLQDVYLTDEFSYLTCWQAIYFDPQLRLEYEGYPVSNGCTIAHLYQQCISVTILLLHSNTDCCQFCQYKECQANTKILIKHCHTNQALAANRKYSLRTYFGKECEVACHTHLDAHRSEKPLNHWILCTGDPSNHSSIILDRPKYPSIKLSSE